LNFPCFHLFNKALEGKQGHSLWDFLKKLKKSHRECRLNCCRLTRFLALKSVLSAWSISLSGVTDFMVIGEIGAGGANAVLMMASIGANAMAGKRAGTRWVFHRHKIERTALKKMKPYARRANHL
jgi:hypothetical protein